ncbi:Fe(3+) ABC transporter substrate-binding protein [Thorsellia anophelis]|uniref:Iron(III) transport system substrate-binding protein n=1 Tax=Thorsellia anophelis DSM 18579 TaxID=1123402 RepID=A0A1I0ATY6_9GAMM|nr:Fe(3+) ABC transporter substrate-binding protein [Thorsellia anophelis]SES97844.1 iron(III) transport system substrate-binding protein [Thorsellia anophelis DSM 18579]
MRHSTLTKSLIASFVSLMSVQAFAADKVTVYTTREPKLIEPILADFTKNTGITVDTIFVKEGLLERVKAEGTTSPADILMTVDIGNLVDLVEAGLTQPINSTTLTEVIPANLRDPNGNWFALSLRDRVLYAATEMPIDRFKYEDLANPEFKGKVCIRSGQHPYNIGMLAAMIEHNGTEKTEQWLRDVKNNLARKATGGDRDVARDILGGICDLGLANAYYVGRMKNAEVGSDERAWGDAIKVIRPSFAQSPNQGTHVNISGAGLAVNAPEKDNAIKLMEFLVSEEAQSLYAKANYEYPVRAGVELDPVVASFGVLNPDSISLLDIAKHRKEASELVDKVGFDN